MWRIGSTVIKKTQSILLTVSYRWSGAGSSTSPCDETYRGAAAGDSPENKGLLAQINALAAGKGVQLFIDVHSYSQLFMTRKTVATLPNLVIY